MSGGKGISLDTSTLLDALPSGIAVVDDSGLIMDANIGFWTAVGRSRDSSVTFDSLFGKMPIACTKISSSFVLDNRHYALAVRNIADNIYACHLYEVTSWVTRQTEAQIASTCDALTGLSNRSAFLPEVDRVLEGNMPAALMMVDLDHFKKVNDTLGHPIGDNLLRKVSERLLASLRKTDRIARLGGDEFAVLQYDVPQPHGAEQLAKRLVELVGRPYVIDGHMIDIGASVGVAVTGTAEQSADLMKQADIALYRAKHAGRGRFCFFEQSMDIEMQERRGLEIDLRRALAFRQFELHYQPQMDLKTKTIVGMEALIRWRHPERGLVSPATFIPLAEETGMIIPIGEWVIRQACDHAAAWPTPVPVAVNVSAKQLATGKLVSTVASALANSGLTPDRLEVEITESVLMSDTRSCVATLHSLRDIGIRVSMDDFGTGYSSLSYLHSFPFHKIKIDQSFIRSGDPQKNDAIVRAITAIGKHLGMATIAEGVETATQLDHVTDSGCGSAQGYLISRPVPSEEVVALLERLASTPIGPDDVSTQENPAPIPPPIIEANLYRLVYYSRNAIMGLNDEVRETVDQILTTSQRNNASVGVTGALIFTDGLFAQVLEGDREAVERVFERIQLDERHGDVQLLSFARADVRAFPNWAMAFVGQSSDGIESFGHYAAHSGFIAAAVDGDQMTSQLRALLLDEERLSVCAAA